MILNVMSAGMAVPADLLLQYIMQNFIANIAWGFVGGAVAWFFTDFIARPIRRFFDLRAEAKALMLLLWDAPESGHQSPDEWQERMDEFKDSRDRLARAGAEIFAFSQSERLAASFIQIFGYDPAGAGRATKTLAFELGTNIEDREKNYRKLDTALKFRFDVKRPFYDPYRPERWKR